MDGARHQGEQRGDQCRCLLSGDAGPFQSGHEVGVFGGVAQALLNDGEDRIDIASNQSGRIEPETGKYRAAQDAVRRRMERLVAILVEDEPVDLPIETRQTTYSRAPLRR